MRSKVLLTDSCIALFIMSRFFLFYRSRQGGEVLEWNDMELPFISGGKFDASRRGKN